MTPDELRKAVCDAIENVDGDWADLTLEELDAAIRVVVEACAGVCDKYAEETAVAARNTAEQDAEDRLFCAAGGADDCVRLIRALLPKA